MVPMSPPAPDVLSHQTAKDPREVLGRAAVWFADQDRIDDAVSHLLRAGRQDDAAVLLERTGETWFLPRGAAATYLQLGEQVPSPAVSPTLALTLATAAALCGDQARVIRWLDAAEAGGTPDTVAPGWHSFCAAVLCWRAAFGVSDAESARSVALATEALDLETQGAHRGIRSHARRSVACWLAPAASTRP